MWDSILIIEKFDKSTSDIQTVINNTKFTKIVSGGIESGEIEKFMQFVLNLASGNEVIGDPFIYGNNSSFFKIKYDLGDDIERACDSGDFENITYDEVRSSRKIKIKYKGSIFAETGSGSIGRVNTESQEIATCVVFNAVVEELAKNPEFKYDFVFIRDLISDISEDFDNSWVVSFYKQIQGILRYLEDNGCNPINYKLERYGGSKKFPDWDLSRTYANFIKKYTKCFPGSQKDNWDPSDVILYNKDMVSEIESDLITWTSELTDELSAATIKEKLKNKYYIGKDGEKLKDIIFKGISLKKISGKKEPHVEIFNVGEGSKVNVSSVVGQKRTQSGFVCIINGGFDFGYVSDSDIDEQKSKDVKLTLRTFGSGRVGIDVCLNENGSPSLGKCPVNIWRGILGCDESIIIDDAIDKFEEMLNGDKVKENLKEIIEGAIKNGPNCLPFILLH